MKKFIKNTKGFTLIELLIVISIIGILSAVVITVVNPVQQQNQAKDATIQAAFNKINLALESHVSAFGEAPGRDQVLTLITGGTAFGSDCATGITNTDQVCRFSLGSVPLTQGCEVENWRGGGGGAETSDACYFRYFTNTSWDDERYRLYAKSWAFPTDVYAFDSMEDMPGIYRCTGSTDLDNVDLSSVCTKVN